MTKHKTGFVYPGVAAVLHERSSTTGWALCVGAGISLPAFPDWQALVSRLIAKDPRVTDPLAMAAALLQSLSPDALIQATANLLDQTPDDFAVTLSNELYARLIDRLSPKEWRVFSRVLTEPSAGAFGGAEWDTFAEAILREFPSMTARPLARLVCDLLGSPLAPAAIVSFNAEATFPALINACASQGWPNRFLPGTRGERRAPLDVITHSVSRRRPGRLPVYFCHGLLRLPSTRRQASGLHAHDKLVFSEASYLALANASYSWQAAVFTDICSARSVVFLGVSLADSNMRRWLTWVHSNREGELRARFGVSAPSAPHYWITKAPGSEVEKSWIEASVAHLGVRLVWIDEWSHSTSALAEMLGVSAQVADATAV